MPQEAGPWLKYQKQQEPAAEVGPWTKYTAVREVPPAKTTGSSAKDMSRPSIGPRPGGVLGWLQNLMADVKTGSTTTLPGRALSSMGAPGLESGVSSGVSEFMGSPVTGAIRTATGVARLPSQPWSGVKDIVGGTMEAGTIPGLLAVGPSEAGSTALSRVEELARDAYRARSVAKATFKAETELRNMNQLLGVSAKELKLVEAPSATGKFVTNPARGALKAGLDEKTLTKMNPVERHAAMIRARNSAGQQLGEVFNRAALEGRTVNLSKVVDGIFKEIPDKNLQSQTRMRLGKIVNKALNRPNIHEDVPWTQLMKDLSNLTPPQAHEIRMGLDDFATFSPEGTAKTFAEVATALRRGVARELRSVVPESATRDQHYSDLAAGTKATERQLKTFAKKGPPPSVWRKTIFPWLVRGAAGTVGGELAYQLGKDVGWWGGGGGAVP